METMTAEKVSHQILPENLKKFITGGYAILTVQSLKSGEHLTYKVVKYGDSPFFVKVLSGPCEEYSYMGIMVDADTKPAFRFTPKSKMTDEAKSVKVFRWLLGHLEDHKKLEENTIIRHEGKCCVCGRALTTPKSIEAGIGPKCEASLNK